MLGRELELLLKEKSIDFVGTDKEVSITDLNILYEFSDSITKKNKKIRWIINCAAYTMVDKAEDETSLCYDINVFGPQNLAKLACDLDASLIHISTDYVFSGDTDSPYSEENPKAPCCVYGSSKSEGEDLVLSLCKNSLIIRTAWLYGRYGHNFVYTMLKLMNQKDHLNVVDDQVGSPTWTKDLANVIITIISKAEIHYGIYHYTNEGQCSWFEFSKEIYRLGVTYGIIKNQCEIRPIKTSEYKTKAKRPLYSVLSKEKIKRVYRIDIPHWKLSLQKFLEEIKRDGEVL